MLTARAQSCSDAPIAHDRTGAKRALTAFARPGMRAGLGEAGTARRAEGR